MVLVCGLPLETVSVLQITRNTTPMYRTPEIVDLYSNFPIGEKQDIWVRLCHRGTWRPRCGHVGPSGQVPACLFSPYSSFSFCYFHKSYL